MSKKNELQTEGSEVRGVAEDRLGEITKPRLLIAEDDLVVRQVLGTMFKMVNYEAAFAENGQKVVDMWESGKYDLILMDIQMLHMNGLEATAAIREKERTCGGHTPIIAMTGHVSKKDEESCLDAGMDSYISKPIDFKACLQLIEETLKNMPMNSGCDTEALSVRKQKGFFFLMAESQDIHSGRVAAILDQGSGQLKQIAAILDQRSEQLEQITARMDQKSEQLEQITARMDQKSRQLEQIAARMDQKSRQLEQLVKRSSLEMLANLNLQ